MKDHPREKFSDRNGFLLISLIAVVSLLLRIENPSYVAESLWSEDGAYLINQAHRLGLSSLWEPFAGYLHLYHRLIALISTLAPLEVTPYIFMAGWIIAFLLIVWVITSRGEMVGVDRIAAVFLILAISLQPNNGEALLNLGQSFYFLNIAFALYVCLPSSRPITIPYLVLLVVLSLSGPASEIVSLVLVVRLVALRDFKLRKWEYLTVWCCALVQASLTFAIFDGGASADLNTNLSEWIYTVLVFLSFGSQSNLVRVASVVFWSITLLSLWKLYRHNGKALELLPLLLAILTAAMMLFGGMVRQSEYMVLMNPIDHESRYFVLPYALAFFVALSVTRNDLKAKMAVQFSIGIICGASFLTLDRVGRMGSTGLYAHENLQWVAFTKFQKVNPNLVIPTNPPWAIWPPVWYVNTGVGGADGGADEYKMEPIRLDLHEVTSDHIAVSSDSGEVSVFSEHTSPEIDFGLKDNCQGEEYLAVEVDVWRSKPGWARLYWRGSEGFSEQKSLSRFYMDGDVTMQFAFRRDISESSLRLDLMRGVDQWLMQEWARNHPSLTAPPPTPAGGQAKIKNIRLFCLNL